MPGKIPSQKTPLWFYLIWPPLIFNLGSVLLISAIYIAHYTDVPDRLGEYQVPPATMEFALGILIVALEWFFAGLLLYQYKRSGERIAALFSPTPRLLDFRLGPALLLFVLFNLIFAGYMLRLLYTMPDLSLRSLNAWQSVLFILVVPLTAAVCEEIIWRGHILTALAVRGYRAFTANLISAVSFALIHGVFFPEKLATTFLIGLLGGAYYQRQKALLPLIFTHWIVDMWSYLVLFFR